MNDNKEKNQIKETAGAALPRSTFAQEMISLILRILWIVLIVVILYYFVVGAAVNRGTRMEPKFQDGDVVFYYRLAHQLSSGEAVVYTDPGGTEYIGRVVAVEGDTVDFTPDGLTVNGYARADDYGQGETVLFEAGPSYPVTLGAGEFFVLCDDRTQGNDSRLLGPLNEKQIRGRVMLVLRQKDF